MARITRVNWPTGAADYPDAPMANYRRKPLRVKHFSCTGLPVVRIDRPALWNTSCDEK